MSGFMPMNALRRFAILVMALALLGGGTVQASPAAHHPEAGASAASPVGEIDCMALMGHAQKDRSVPCKHCDAGCPAIADCAGLSLMTVDPFDVSAPIRSPGARCFAPAEDHAGLSVPPLLFPPIAL